MKIRRDVISDDWKTNWQQSIAVRISALVLWTLLPATLFTALLLLYDTEESLKTEYTKKTEFLYYRLGEYGKILAQDLDQKTKTEINSILEKHEITFITITLTNKEIPIGIKQPNLSKTVYSPSNHSTTGYAEYPIQKIAIYHPDIYTQANDIRKNILIPVILGILFFGMFLMWAIRTTVHKPLNALVTATRAVCFGDTSIRFDVTRQDEFGYLSRFFNEMLDELMDRQKQLQLAVADAEIANKAKSLFLANMSHELRTPLNAIIGYSEMLVDDATDADELQHIPDLQNIKTAGKHLLDLINNILDLSKVEAGKMELHIEKIDVNTMIDHIVNTIRPLIENNHNTLTLNIPKNIGIMITDTTKVRQCVINLLSNSCKFTFHGTISLTAKTYTSDNIEKINFSVSDTGIGIPEDNLEILFQAFRQGDNSIVKNSGGTGLGLAICQYFCSMLNGSITVESKEGKGTNFTIELPMNFSSQG